MLLVYVLFTSDFASYPRAPIHRTNKPASEVIEFECRSGRSGGFGPEELDCIAPGYGQDGQELNVQSLQIQTDGQDGQDLQKWPPLLPPGGSMLGAATPARGASHCGVPCGPKGSRNIWHGAGGLHPNSTRGFR